MYTRITLCSVCFFFNDTATTEIYTLSLHDALPIFSLVTRLGGLVVFRDLTRDSAWVALDREEAFRKFRQLAESRVKSRKDRKSTRLNSSHLVISYAVFCLKKKKKNTDLRRITIHSH